MYPLIYLLFLLGGESPDFGGEMKRKLKKMKKKKNSTVRENVKEVEGEKIT